MEIPKIRLNNSIKMPMIGLGTAELLDEECIKTIKKALEIGYNHLDTAESYMNENEIGLAIKNFNRDKLFITSKISPIELDFYKVLGACEESLARLETHYLDLYLIHWPDKSLNSNLKEILKAFKKLYDLGKIKSFGISNFTINHLKYTIKITEELGLPVSVNQIEFHPFLYQKELLNFCNKNNIAITSYSPLAKGLVFNDPILSMIGEKYKKTAGQISLKWLLNKGTIIIPKASTEKHLKENLDLDFEINNNDIKKIDEISKERMLVRQKFSEFG